MGTTHHAKQKARNLASLFLLSAPLSVAVSTQNQRIDFQGLLDFSDVTAA